MANLEHLAKLKQTLEPESTFPWNQWRRENPELKPDLSKAYLERIDFKSLNLTGVNFREADLMFANFVGCDLSDADFKEANLCYAILRTGLPGANLQSAHLLYARLEGADLRGANLRHADLRGASLDSADLTDAKITGANLQRASLVDASLERAHLAGCLVYGISAWNVNLEGAVQKDLLVNRWYAGDPIEFYSPTGVDQSDEPELVVDDLELAQFIHVMLSNQKLRKMIDTVTSKMVLILGRFTEERKSILDAIREELRNRGLLP